MSEYFDFDFTKASFEWDEEKDRINYKKHGIHFKTAAKVFLDPHMLMREDVEHPQEQRYDILGRVGKILSTSAEYPIHRSNRTAWVGVNAP